MTDILDTLINDGSFNTLVTAFKAANLVDNLKSRGSLTLLAPNDQAFSKLHEGMVDGLAEDIPLLEKILTHHIFSSKVMAADMAVDQSIKINERSNVNIEINQRLKVNRAKVLKSDIKADNGVFHSIDTVLMPW